MCDVYACTMQLRCATLSALVIRLYTTRYCGYCSAARRVLAEGGYVYEEIDVSRDYELRQRISKQAGNYRMLPMIFIDDQFIGGYDQLAALERSGQLAARCTRASSA
jgi:glutaredoxin 3